VSINKYYFGYKYTIFIDSIDDGYMYDFGDYCLGDDKIEKDDSGQFLTTKLPIFDGIMPLFVKNALKQCNFITNPALL
jgi:hypothetical protein